jgi:hypothetical protein
MIDLTTMNRLSHEYYDWLVTQIDIRGARTFNELFGRMHELEFVWFVPNDDNRVQDGLDLRNEFLNKHGHASRRETRDFSEAMNKGATVLEVLVALSRRVAFTAGGHPKQWAWKLIENLDLDKSSDPLTRHKHEKVDEILDSLIWRTYHRDGQGGFFPLNWADQDQTKVEIWYQMNKYVNEIQEP